MAKHKQNSKEAKVRAFRRNHLCRFLKRVIYFKPTTFIGTVVLTAIITALVQKGMTKPKEHHRRPQNSVVQVQSGTNYVAQCSGCGRRVNVKTTSDKPEIECLACQKQCDIIMALSDEAVPVR